MDAFERLGLERTATQEEVRKAYHDLVKANHPDLFTDEADQLRAQEAMVQLNLAYREALERSSKGSGYIVQPPEKAWERAQIYFAREEWDRALVQLSHIQEHDLDWYRMQGDILMKMNQYASALQAYKICVKLAPEDQECHQRCLDAAVALRKRHSLPHRIADWVKGIFS